MLTDIIRCFIFYINWKKEICFYLVYKGDIFKYQVLDVKVVSASSVDYLTGSTIRKLATLMTCWSAGTTLERLVVVGELVEE